MTKIITGLHRHTGKADEKLTAYVLATRPTMVKFLDDYPGDLIRWCNSQGVLTVGRTYFGTQTLSGRQGRDAIERARGTGLAATEFHNEAWQGGADMGRYSDASIAFMQDCEAAGLKAVIGCFSTGQPEIGEWHRFLPALKMAAERGHYVGLHEYGGPIMQWGAGLNQWVWTASAGRLSFLSALGPILPTLEDPAAEYRRREAMAKERGPAYSLLFADDPFAGHPGRINDPCLGGNELGWWCLRYRRHVAEWRRLGLTTIPKILITEGGLDDINPRPGPIGKGYKDYVGGEWSQTIHGDYAKQWAWYCWQIAHDPYVAGACDFGWATEDPTWNSFDLSTDPVMLARLMEEMRRLLAVGDPAPTPTPQPIPQPIPPAERPGLGADVLPMIQTRRGEGWAAVAGRAGGNVNAAYGTRLRWAGELAAANGLATTDAVPIMLRVPWAKVAQR